LEFLPHVDDFNFRREPLALRSRAIPATCTASSGVGDSSDGVAEPSTTCRIRHLGPHHRDIAGAISRRLFLLIGWVLFLVDYQRQIGDGSKHRRTRATTMRASPRLMRCHAGAFFIGERRMQNGNSFSNS
jgi:hypothetical protein